MNTLEFLTWVDASAPGDRVEYWSGFLAADRTKDGRKRSFAEAQEISALARAALDAGERGLVHLLQRRNGHGCVYIAERRDANKSAIEHESRVDKIRRLHASGLGMRDIKIRLSCSWTAIKLALEDA